MSAFQNYFHEQLLLKSPEVVHSCAFVTIKVTSYTISRQTIPARRTTH